MERDRQTDRETTYRYISQKHHLGTTTGGLERETETKRDTRTHHHPHAPTHPPTHTQNTQVHQLKALSRKTA